MSKLVSCTSNTACHNQKVDGLTDSQVNIDHVRDFIPRHKRVRSALPGHQQVSIDQLRIGVHLSVIRCTRNARERESWLS